MSDNRTLGTPDSGGPHRTALPRTWHRILREQPPRELVFACYYEEFSDSFTDRVTHERFEENPMETKEACGQRTYGQYIDGTVTWNDPGFGAMELPLVELRAGDLEPLPSGDWGDDAAFIESWFDEGEALADTPLPPDAVPQPDKWERARDFMRSLAVSAGLLPA